MLRQSILGTVCTLYSNKTTNVIFVGIGICNDKFSSRINLLIDKGKFFVKRLIPCLGARQAAKSDSIILKLFPIDKYKLIVFISYICISISVKHMTHSWTNKLNISATLGKTLFNFQHLFD